MVGTAGPSTGCQTCKNRRIKCDETRPACRRCVNSRRICPGYLEPFDVVFRDETRNTIAKYRDLSAPKRRKLYHSTDPANPYRQYEQLTWIHEGITEDSKQIKSRYLSAPAVSERRLSQPARSPPKQTSPTLSAEDVERSAVIDLSHEFIVFSNRSSLDGSFFHHAHQQYVQAPAWSPIHLATRALALLILPGATGAIRKKAYDYYGRALKSIVTAMSDRILSTSNEILASIWMLAIYEAMAVQPDHARSYDKHLSGALSVLHDRGNMNWADPSSRSIFRGLRSLLVMRCLQKSESPESLGFGQFWRSEWEYVQGDPSQQMHLLTAAVAHLRARAKDVFYDSLTILLVSDVEAIMEEAAAMDQQLLNWHESLQGIWYYQSHASTQIPSWREMSVEDSPIWPGPIHIYHEIFIASVINQYRMHRILVHMIIQECLDWLDRFSPGFPTTTEGRAQSDQVMKDMVDEICSSVPYHFEQLPSDVRDYGYPITKVEARVVPYLIAAPLQLASTVNCICDIQRTWLRHRLDFLSSGNSKCPETIRLIKEATFAPVTTSAGLDFVLKPQHI